MKKHIIGIVSYFICPLPGSSNILLILDKSHQRETKLMRLSNHFWVVCNSRRKTCFPQEDFSSLCNMSSLKTNNWCLAFMSILWLLSRDFWKVVLSSTLDIPFKEASYKLFPKHICFCICKLLTTLFPEFHLNCHEI